MTGIATNAYYMGMFGLGDQPTNITNLTNPHPSFLTTMKSSNLIPSLSWAYTAGAPYRKFIASISKDAAATELLFEIFLLILSIVFVQYQVLELK